MNDLDEAIRKAEASVEGSGRPMIERMIERMGGRSAVEAVFGAPVERDGLTVIPVARVMWGVGGGEGGDKSTGAEGTGAGGGMVGTPLGFIEIGPEGATYRPLSQLPSPLFLLAAGVTAGIVLRALARLVRG